MHGSALSSSLAASIGRLRRLLSVSLLRRYPTLTRCLLYLHASLDLISYTHHLFDHACPGGRLPVELPHHSCSDPTMAAAGNVLVMAAPDDAPDATLLGTPDLEAELGF
ncbi:hypothetical protein E2562_003189 [Oryza meyeriana var. granulata]|uniref:Uncharacterized protein n=1 Tax=Oryza meyeriana var. granulata TaxID=110450 RepID=A0A6G1EUU2_9ORYZ|nr:hypothetical protein E2562_003189 [Oryza meyeriana var. granulata]